jgi:putative aminopeptidase FrvX
MASSGGDGHAMKDALRTTLRDLMALHGAPGFEQPLVQYFQKRVAALVDQVEVDRYGNVAATKRGRQPHPRLMLSAHLDEIGLIVKAVEPTGFRARGRWCSWPPPLGRTAAASRTPP